MKLNEVVYRCKECGKEIPADAPDKNTCEECKRK